MEVARRIADPDLTLHAPQLLDLEVVSVLRRYVLRKAISQERADLALEQLVLLDLSRYDHQILLPRIWMLRDNVTPYDAAYVALAEALDAPLLTADRRLAAAPGTLAQIETI